MLTKQFIYTKSLKLTAHIMRITILENWGKFIRVD